MKKTSIIIPVFNQAHYLVQAIESCYQQTADNIEVLVVNDGSTDNTAQVVAPYLTRPNFKYVEQPNAGLPGARNRGFAESTGEYLCFLDSDDYYHPEKIRKQAELLEEDPELGFVYCDLVSVDDNGQPLLSQWSVRKRDREMSGNIFGSLMLGGYFPPHTVMIRRSVLEKVGPFDPELGGHADYDLWLRVSGAGHRAVYIDEKLAFYRYHSTNMSKDGMRMAETRLATFRKIVVMFPQAAAEATELIQRATRDMAHVTNYLRGSAKHSHAELVVLREKYTYATEGEIAPKWIRGAFELLPPKLRRSIRKRINCFRSCFDGRK